MIISNSRRNVLALTRSINSVIVGTDGPARIAITAGLVWVAATAATYAWGQPAAATAVHDTHHTSAADSIQVHEEAKHAKPKIIAKSDGGITITFDNCRENAKQHVSCQFEDEAGDSHWVYLPGVPLPGSK